MVRRTSPAIMRGQCGVPVLDRDCVRAVLRSGPQPQSCKASVARRSSPAILRGQCSVPDLNRDHVHSVWRVPHACQKEGQKICQKECQKIYQKVCQKKRQKDNAKPLFFVELLHAEFKIDLKIGEDNEKPEVIRCQFPLLHGMLRTAYSAQGLTLDGGVLVDLRRAGGLEEDA